MAFSSRIHHLSRQAGMLDATPAATREAMAEQTRWATIAATGIDAKATVVAAHTTSAQVNLDPILELELTVLAAGRPPYPVTVRQIVSPRHISKVRPGAHLVAKVDPEDSAAVWVDLVHS